MPSVANPLISGMAAAAAGTDPLQGTTQALQQLLAQQRRESEALRSRYQEERARQEKQWRQAQLQQQQGQQGQRAALQQQQRNHLNLLRQYARVGRSGQQTVQLLKLQRADWQKFSQQERHLLERLAMRGASGGELLRELQAYQHKRLLQQQQQQQQQRLQAREAYQTLGQHLEVAYRQAQAQQRERHVGQTQQLRARLERERQMLREQQHQRRQQERLQQRQREQALRYRREILAAAPYRLTGAMRAAAGIGQGFVNPYLTKEQQTHQIGESLAQLGGRAGVIGEAIAAFTDLKRVVDGTAGALQQLAIGAQRAPLAARLAAGLTRLEQESDYQQLTQQARARAFAGAADEIAIRGAGLEQLAGQRDTYRGEIAYREAAIRFRADAQLARARSVYEAAQLQEKYAEQLVKEGRLVNRPPRRPGPYGVAPLPAGERALQVNALEIANTLRELRRAYAGPNQATQAAQRAEATTSTALATGLSVYGIGSALGVSRFLGNSLGLFFGNRARGEEIGGNVGRFLGRNIANIGAMAVPIAGRVVGGATGLILGNQKEVAEALQRHMEATERQAQAVRLQEEAINRLYDARVQTANSLYELRRAELNKSKAELEILTYRERALARGAVALGRMGPGEQASLRVAMRMVQSGMPVNLIPQYHRSLLEQAFGEGMSKLYERAGLKSDLFKEAQQQGLLVEGELDKIRKEQAQLQTKVEVKLALNEEEFARKIANAIGERLEKLWKVIDVKNQTEIQRMEAGMHARNITG